MRNVAETLALDQLFVVCPTPHAYPLDAGITVLPITAVVDLRPRIAPLWRTDRHAHPRRSSRNSEAGSTPVTSRRSRARVQAT